MLKENFTEIQKNKPWYLWLLAVLLNGFILYMLISQIIFDQPVGNNPTSDAGVILISAVMLLFTVILMSIRMETRIDEQGIFLRFFPFHLRFRKIIWSDIEKVYLRSYKPLREYGGWGIKGTRNNRAFNYSGKTGLQLEMKDGRKILIGTNLEKEMEIVLKQLKKLDIG